MQKSRGGVAMGDPLTERILNYGELNRDNITYFVRIGPTRVEVWNGAVWTSIANTALTGTDVTTVDFAYPEIGGSKIMVYTNLEDNIRKFTGAGNDADLGGSPPKAKYLLNYNGYLLLANIDAAGSRYRSRVQWPDAGDPENWSTGDAGAVDLLEDDLEITGAKIFGEYAAIHKERAIYLGYLTGTDQVFRFDRKEVGSGAIAHMAIVNIPTGQQIYLSREGLRLFNGITAPAIPSTINEELADSMNVQFLFRNWGVIVRDLNEVHFGICIGSSEEPDTIYKYNYLTQTVYKDQPATGITVAGLYTKTADDSWDSDSETWDSDTTNWDSQSALALHQRVVYAQGDTGLSIERSDTADFNGEAIESFWEGKDFTAFDFQHDDSEGSLMEWQGIEIVARGTSVSVYYSTDEGASFTLARTITLTSDFPLDSAPLIAYFRAVSSKCRPKFVNEDEGGALEIKQFRMMAVSREERAA